MNFEKFKLINWFYVVKLQEFCKPNFEQGQNDLRSEVINKKGDLYCYWNL